MKIPEEIREICRQIGAFYLKKNGGDYDAAAKEIERIKFTNIRLVNGYGGEAIEITVNRPGLFIGKRGENCEALAIHLGKKIELKEAEDHLENHLIPHKPIEMDEDYSCYDYEDYEMDGRYD